MQGALGYDDKVEVPWNPAESECVFSLAQQQGIFRCLIHALKIAGWTRRTSEANSAPAGLLAPLLLFCSWRVSLRTAIAPTIQHPLQTLQILRAWRPRGHRRSGRRLLQPLQYLGDPKTPLRRRFFLFDARPAPTLTHEALLIFGNWRTSASPPFEVARYRTRGRAATPLNGLPRHSLVLRRSSPHFWPTLDP
jgi:hypothetical protein